MTKTYRRVLTCVVWWLTAVCLVGSLATSYVASATTFGGCAAGWSTDGGSEHADEDCLVEPTPVCNVIQRLTVAPPPEIHRIAPAKVRSWSMLPVCILPPPQND